MIRDDYAGIGWAEGLRWLGLDEVGIEWDPDACATRTAAGYKTIRADLSLGAPMRDQHWDGYLASPPCQTFSMAGQGSGRPARDTICDRIECGYWRTKDLDERTAHAVRTAQVCDTIDADWIILEQVPFLLPVWETIAQRLQTRGYDTVTGMIVAADYGIAQTRKRAVLLANRTRELGGLPPPTHNTQTWVSWGEALGLTGAITTDGRRRNPPVRFHRPAPTVTSSSGIRDRWIVSDLVLDRRNTQRAAAGGREPVVPIPGDCPAPTITTQAAGGQWVLRRPDEVLPDYQYRLGLAEMARLQSFRADLPWRGSRTSIGRQIGNAVPPLLAAHLVAHVAGIEVPQWPIVTVS